MPPTTTMAGAVVRLNCHSRSAMNVTTNEHVAVVKKSGTRQRPSRRASRLTPMLTTKAMADDTGPPPRTPTKAAAKTPKATVTIQRGKGLGLVMASSRRRMASSRPTPPATMSVTSWWTLASPA